MTRTLIKGGSILSMDPSIGDISVGDVLIEDDKIVEVGSQIDASDVEIIDASDMIVMPGLVNTHLHTWQTGLRGMAADWNMSDYLRAMHAGIAPAFGPDDIHIGNLIGALNQLSGGVTTVFDWCHNNPTPDHTEAAIDALEASGIRALFGHGTPKPDPKEGQRHFSEEPQPRSEIERLAKGRLSSNDKLVTLGMCILGPHYGVHDVNVHDLKLAREYDLLVSAHMGVGHARMVPDGIKKLFDEGLFDERFNVVHGNDLSDEEMKMIGGNGGSLTPTTGVEIQMGFGFPVTGRFLDAGGTIGLGIDVESNVTGDLFQEMRFTLSLQRLFENEPNTQANKPVAPLHYKARDALKWATIDGAKLMRMDHKIGSLTPGKQADVILIRMRDLNMFPVNRPAEQVVFYANCMNVDTVLVDGKIMKSNGVLNYQGLDDKMDKLANSAQSIFERAGVNIEEARVEE